ncbi:MAG: hypothetical protein WDO73_25260 [Ignavibacteriota bacterium]
MEHLAHVDPNEPKRVMCACCQADYLAIQRARELFTDEQKDAMVSGLAHRLWADLFAPQPEAELVCLMARDGMALLEAGVTVPEADEIARRKAVN